MLSETKSPLSSGDFRVDQIRLEDRVVLFLGGELDIATVPILQGHLADLATERAENIEIDFSDLGFIDSSGLAVLVRSRYDLERSGGSLVVRNASKAARRLFEVTELTQTLMGTREPVRWHETQHGRRRSLCRRPESGWA